SRVANLSLATSRQWTGQGGEKQEKTEWHRVICWNNKGAQLADLAEKYMKKGDRIYVEGRIEYRTWEDREQQTRHVHGIIAPNMPPRPPRLSGRDSFPPRTPSSRARRSGRSRSCTTAIPCCGPKCTG